MAYIRSADDLKVLATQAAAVARVRARFRMHCLLHGANQPVSQGRKIVVISSFSAISPADGGFDGEQDRLVLNFAANLHAAGLAQHTLFIALWPTDCVRYREANVTCAVDRVRPLTRACVCVGGADAARRPVCLCVAAGAGKDAGTDGVKCIGALFAVVPVCRPPPRVRHL